MKEIKFSHNYLKFIGKKLPLEVELLQCFRIHKKELSEAFIAYDTTYEGGFYELPDTELIVLLLWIPDDFCLTTVRRYTPSKWEYYKSLEGKIVKLVESVT